MSDKLVQVTAKTIVAAQPTYTPQSGTLISQSPVTAEANLPSITTSVENITVVSSVSNMGEEVLPNPSFFVRGIDSYKPTDTIRLRYGKFQTNQTTTLDTFNRRVDFRRTISDLQVTNDSYVSFTINNVQIDPLTTSDVLRVSFTRPFAHTVAETDTTLLEVTKVITDLSTLSDTTRYFDFGKSLSETAATTDVFDRVVNFNVEFVSLIDATDDFFGEANIDDDQIALVGKSVIDWIASSETTVFVVGNNPVDAISALDQPIFNASTVQSDSGVVQDQTLLNSGKNVSSTGTTSELVTQESGKNIVDATVTSELFSNSVFKQLLDPLIAQETFLAQTAKLVQDGFVLSDVLTAVWQAQVQLQSAAVSSELTQFNVGSTITDQTVSADQLSYSATIPLSDAFTTADVLSTLSGFNRDFVSSVVVTDDFLGLANIDDDQTATVGKSVADSSTTTDQARLSPTKVLTSAFAGSDNFLITTVNKVVETPVSGTDTIEFFLFTSRFFDETLSANDSGFINNQSYFASSYVEPGYVGTNINFS